MTDSPARKPTTETQSSIPIVIPDGGLGAGLPDWMQARPSWSSKEQVESVAPTETVSRASIPAPDTTVIDLTSILVASDLPMWLQSLTTRPKETGSFQQNDQLQPDTPVAEILAIPVQETTLAMSSTQSDEANRLPTSAANEASESHSHPWWATDRIFGLLMAAIVVTLLLVVLRLTSVL